MRNLLLLMLFVLLVTTFVGADPIPVPKLPEVFCIRITGVEKTEEEKFRISLEFLNWTLLSNFEDFRNPTGLELINAAKMIPGATIVVKNGILQTQNGVDALGDSSVDGGPGVTPNPVIPDGSANVLDGVVLEVNNFGIGDRLALNWFLLDENNRKIGTPNNSNLYGFGTLNLARVNEDETFLNPLFPSIGNTGFTINTTLLANGTSDIGDGTRFIVVFCCER